MLNPFETEERRAFQYNVRKFMESGLTRILMNGMRQAAIPMK